MTNKEAINFLRGKMKLLGELNYVYSEEDYALDMAIRALEQQEKERWIPVGERLPEEHGEQDECEHTSSDLVLITVRDDNGNTFITDDITVNGEWVNYENYNYFEVIAWKPMPEEYKGE